MTLPINYQYPNTQAVQQLQSLPQPIYLGGSRYMAVKHNAKLPNVKDPKILAACVEYVRAQRYHVGITESTDYDFYATHHPSLEQCLISTGWAKVAPRPMLTITTSSGTWCEKEALSLNGGSSPYDLDTEAVSIFEMQNMQLILRRDALFYKWVVDKIPIDTYFEKLWKSGPFTPDRPSIQNYFNSLFSTYRQTKEFSNAVH
jgi:hypothetical protein